MILETFMRTFVDPEALDATVGFYKALLAGEQTLRFDYPELGLPVGRKMRYRHADGLIVEYVEHAS